MGDEDKQQIALHKAEVKELQRQYDRDLKLQDFLSIKGGFGFTIRPSTQTARKKNKTNHNRV